MSIHPAEYNDERYRFWLEREVPGGNGTTVAWLMLNPSTATDDSDNPTIRKVKGFTRRLIGSRAIVVNLFPMRATKPEVLLRASMGDRFGNLGRHFNDDAIDLAKMWSDKFIIAWGARGSHPSVQKEITRHWFLRFMHWRLLVLDETLDGHPWHPLMCPYRRVECIDEWSGGGA